ncbi:SDR family oxidoreductase [Rhodococcus sp. 05-2256-B2]|uniref:SDR family oxidoreductase n=1 Tax=Nocardiaceae TaxID=85025 RepID=UPI00068DF115|nr:MULTISPECIES: SDR family oxidoreductase [Rhodococcus]OZD80359.1 SDR family oxidoreductase [Rhodococcus sp. 05-2256-B4]OZD87363.1 SDR family oxidoreductase [Rhodococcus sp. 05-2256-B3]OZD94851.1 SDR family oxidoreductase [Rhodococcus sp. 05-2256-B2]OZE07897.1 SDR family oxidoreductase [Rhodococcus sp. 05-2256-B1]
MTSADNRLTGCNILVLGGGSGIGRGAAEGYRRAGAHVTVVERSAQNARRLSQEADVSVIVGDATSPAVVGDAIRSVVESRGSIDNLTCCVGVFDHYASLRTLTDQEFEQAAEEMWRVNVLSTLHSVKQAWASLQEAGGSVTLTLSESAFHPTGGGVLYAASKWALRGAVSHLATDFAPRVRVNGVAPGGTTGTAFSGLQALRQDHVTVDAVEGREERIAGGSLMGFAATPDDHAAAYVYLADPVGARVVTGTVINSDGGHGR